MITHQTLYESLCAALRRPLSEGGCLALTAALHDQATEEIARVITKLSPAEALAVFKWLDNARAAPVLDGLDEELAWFLLRNTPSGRLADLPPCSLMNLR